MRVLRWSVNTLSGEHFSDTSSGFRAFSAPVLEFFARSYPVEFMDSTESLLLASQRGFRIAEVPVLIRARSAGQPSTRHVWLVYHYVRLMVVMMSHISRKRFRQSARSQS